MSTVTGDYHDPSSSTMGGDTHVDDTTQAGPELEDVTLIDENEEHYSTGYSEFCDDDTILACPDTIRDEVDSSPTESPPATTLGKRKAFEDSGLSNSVYAYKKRTSTGSVDSAESSTEPYIIVSLDQCSLSVPKTLLFR